MTHQEMVKVLKGTNEEKISLYNSFFARISQGEQLEDTEFIVFETLKRMLTLKSEVVEMSASLKGKSFVGV